ncbi:hypothetical protein MJN69_28025, partial [Salmonella enterica subsp. enterica serovar Kentucky]|nr:hypothetical protein [Salmonella enterica subsp. enterica serovar Kentucky]
GTAWILIQENPIKGYGYGNDVYDGVYNKRVVDYPTWTFKESIPFFSTALLPGERLLRLQVPGFQAETTVLTGAGGSNSCQTFNPA